MLWALIIQRIFSIPTDSLLIIFLNYSKYLRDFCGFSKVPYASKFTRFKQDFLLNLQSMFHKLVDFTEPICQNIDTHKASMTIFDTSGIEAFVTENNSKYVNKIIKQVKAYKKSAGLDDSYDPYKAAYGSMPSHDFCNKEIKQLYINGHFCYVYKSLLQDFKFEKAYIPLNSRSKIKNEQCPINEDGIPCCPIQPNLLMKYEGITKRKDGLIR